MKPRVYQYSKCSTCRKALAYLERTGVDYESVDIVTHPPTKRELEQALKLSGLAIKKLFNTSGQSYREGKFGEKLATMSDADALAALAADGKLVKRPFIVTKEFALVGFDEAAYRARFG